MPRAVINPKSREVLAVVGFFALCALCLFGFRISQGYVLAPEDGFVQNYPAFASEGKLWTPLLLSGFPVLADPQVQFFYPLAWLAKHLYLGADWTANFNLYVASAYILAAYFAALLAKKVTGSFYAGLIAGLSYGFSGYLISELKHVQVLHTALWLPLILYLMELVRSQVDGGDSASPPDLPLPASLTSILPFLCTLFALSLVVACTVLAGHPQTASYVLATAFAYALLLTAICRRRLLFLCPTILAIGSGILITAVQLLPSMELSSFSARTKFTFRDFIVGQVEPLDLLGFGFPYILGGAYGTIGNLPFSEQGAPPGLLYFGFAPIFLAVFAIFKAKEQKRILFFAGLTVFTFFLSFGAHTPLSLLVYAVPPFGSFRGLYRVLILLTFGISMLASFGMARLEREYSGNTPKNHGWDLGQIGPYKHLLFCLYFGVSFFCHPFFLGSLPLLLFFVKIKRLQLLYLDNSTIRQKILIGAVFAVLAGYALNAEWIKASPLASEFKPPAVATAYGLETAKSLSRILTIQGLQGEREQLPPNLSRLWRVASATGYEPLVSLRYSRLLGISEGGFVQPPWHINGANRAFDIASVRFLFAPSGEFSRRAFDAQSKKYWKLTQVTDRTLIYENNRVLPRFYLVPKSLSLAAESVYQSVTGGKLPDGTIFDPASLVLLEGQGVTQPCPANTTTKTAPSALALLHSTNFYQIPYYSLNDEKLVFKVKLEKSGYFVLADLFYPGWQVTIDGQRAEILRANYVQRAVPVARGEHTLIFSYRPDSLAFGRTITIATLLVWLILLASAFALRIAKH